MFGLSRGRQAGASLAEVAEFGGPGYSGMVGPGSPVTTDPDAGGRRDDTGRHTVNTQPQPTSDLLPIPGVVTREMVGGLRTAHHAELLRDGGMFDGSHIELVNRRSVVVLAPSEQLMPEVPDVLPSLRVPPPSDPYGRACNNAREAARR